MSDKPASTPEEIWQGLAGAMDGIQVFHNHIIVATYRSPGVSKGGIILTDKTRDEDKWQGKVGMVIAKGPLAFQDDGRTKFNGQDVEIGDWVMYRVNDTSAIEIKEMHCRMLEDIHIRGKIADPTNIF